MFTFSFSASNASINLQNQAPAEEQNKIEIEADSREILEMIAQINQEEKDKMICDWVLKQQQNLLKVFTYSNFLNIIIKFL